MRVQDRPNQAQGGREGAAGVRGGLWGYFPALALNLVAKAMPLDALPVHVSLETMDAIGHSIGRAADALEAKAEVFGGAWQIRVLPRAGMRWAGRAALVRYARALEEVGMLRKAVEAGMRFRN